ncbi:MAG TPA: copper resistance protein CopC [Stellaceae bacterium]|nr:copper resistance protein CopC [Stellaceae bacterium]
MKKHSGRLALLLAGSLIAMPGLAQAHAYPKTAEPAADSTVSPAPSAVKIWFTGKLEPAFSKIAVQDASGVAVDKGNAAVDPQDATLMQVSLKKLPPGTYKVHWHAVSVDTHATDGDFSFTVK